jgi:hypothetical protein
MKDFIISSTKTIKSKRMTPWSFLQVHFMNGIPCRDYNRIFEKMMFIDTDKIKYRRQKISVIESYLFTGYGNFDVVELVHRYMDFLSLLNNDKLFLGIGKSFKRMINVHLGIKELKFSNYSYKFGRSRGEMYYPKAVKSDYITKLDISTIRKYRNVILGRPNSSRRCYNTKRFLGHLGI